MESMYGLRYQRTVKIDRDNQHVSYDLEPLKTDSCYYTRIIISDVTVKDLKLISEGVVIRETDGRELDFPELFLRKGTITFTVTSRSLFNRAVINLHKHSDSVYNFYL
jgi:hypothetical protein